MCHPIIRQVVNRQHAAAAPRRVIRAMRTAFKDYKAVPRATRHALYIDGLKLHNENRQLYISVLNGTFKH